MGLHIMLDTATKSGSERCKLNPDVEYLISMSSTGFGRLIPDPVI
jgi:hypothetical protein